MNPEATDSANLLNLLAWIDVHKKKLLAGLCVLAAVGGGVLIYRELRAQAEAEASAAVLMIEKPGFRSASTNRVAAQALLDLASRHAGTEAGGHAILLAAETLFSEGKFAEASSQFERFSREYAGSPLLPSAAFGLAACIEGQGKAKEALTAYQDVASRHPDSSVAVQARLAAARLLEAAKQPDQAFKIYDDLAKPTSQSAWANEARSRREALLKAHPELTPTNAPAAVVSPSLSGLGTNALPVLQTNVPAAAAKP